MAKKFKKILVTGADGFIGSHLTETLVRQGYAVKAFVFYNSFNRWGWLDHSPKDIVSELEIFAGDIRDPFATAAAVSGCDAVLHLAALIGIPYSYYAPATYVDTNITGTLNVLQACRDKGIDRIIHTSTSEVYGTALTVPITETHPLQGQSPYSATKIAADQMALAFYRSFASPLTIVRPFNTYGPRQSARAVIPTIILQLIDGVRAVKLGSLHPTRDLNFVDDTVRGFISALLADGCEGEVVNIGSNHEISVKDLAMLIASIMDTSIEITSDQERFRPELSEVDRLLADNSKAKSLFNWSPEYNGREGLKRGLSETICWFENRENRAFYKAGYNI
jgi:dTDP-glucose 4,6-dehydratase